MARPIACHSIREQYRNSKRNAGYVAHLFLPLSRQKRDNKRGLTVLSKSVILSRSISLQKPFAEKHTIVTNPTTPYSAHPIHYTIMTIQTPHKSHLQNFHKFPSHTIPIPHNPQNFRTSNPLPPLQSPLPPQQRKTAQ